MRRSNNSECTYSNKVVLTIRYKTKADRSQVKVEPYTPRYLQFILINLKAYQSNMSDARKLILITGGTGFIGNHTVSQFLSNGYRVRATVRNQDTCDRFLSIHRRHRDSLETLIVADITRPRAFDTAVKDVDGIAHMASPFTYKITDNEEDLIVPAINGTKGILQSTVSFAPKVKRVVLTSSFASIADFSKGLRRGHVYEESQWSPLTYQATKDDKRGLAYA